VVAGADAPHVSTRVVEPFISLPLGLFSYTERFSLQMVGFVTSPELSCERGVTTDAPGADRCAKMSEHHEL
jgi:hypothetical protein